MVSLEGEERVECIATGMLFVIPGAHPRLSESNAQEECEGMIDQTLFF